MDAMNKNTMADLDELLDFNNELFDLYQAMKDLDNNGKRYSDEFRKIVNRINEIIAITSTIEARIASNYDELKKAICFLDEKLNLSYDPNEINSIMCFGGPREQMVPMRIVNNLSKYYSNIVDVKDIFEGENVDYDDEMLDNATKMVKFRHMYGSIISTNIDNMVLAKIKKEGLFDSFSLGECFYSIKYDIAFLNTDIEKELLLNNYEINESPYILKSGINNFFGINMSDNEDYKMEVFDSVISGNLELLTINDMDIAQNKSLGAEIITYAYCILSALILMDNDVEARKIMNRLSILADEINKYRTFIIVKNMLDIIIDDYEETKNIYQFISIGGR